MPTNNYQESLESQCFKAYQNQSFNSTGFTGKKIVNNPVAEILKINEYRSALKTATVTREAVLSPGKSQISTDDYFEEPIVEIQRFDRRFSKTGLRGFKYPRIELDKITKTPKTLQ